MSALKDGLYPNFSRADYDALGERENFSLLKHLHRSPAHYRYAVLQRGRDADTDAKKMGRVVHMAVFEPGRFASSIAVWDGDRRAGKDWEKFKLANAGKELLRVEDVERCMAIQAAVRADPSAMRYVANGRGELTMLWTHKVADIGGNLGETLLFCRGRLDFDAQAAIVDLKTCKDASPAGFAKAIWEYRLHSQAAWYSDAYYRITGKKKPYKLLCVESAPPFITQVYNVPDELLALGREEYSLWLERLVWCRATNTWPGYAADGEEIDAALPPWAMPRDGEDLSDEGLTVGGEPLA